MISAHDLQGKSQQFWNHKGIDDMVDVGLPSGRILYSLREYNVQIAPMAMGIPGTMSPGKSEGNSKPCERIMGTSDYQNAE